MANTPSVLACQAASQYATVLDICPEALHTLVAPIVASPENRYYSLGIRMGAASSAASCHLLLAHQLLTSLAAQTRLMTARSQDNTSYKGLQSASTKASAAARGASRQQDTAPEVILRRALWKRGLRYRKNVSAMPGKPDIVFASARIAIFCDGDFWHGKDWDEKKQKLSVGNNPRYWIAKIEGNMTRDKKHTRALQSTGWTVLRFWESDILQNADRIARSIQPHIKRATARPQ